MKTTSKSLRQFTIVNPTTKRAKTIRWYFEHVNKGGIYDAYVKPSYAKVRAYDDCMAMVREYKGFAEKITGYNSCTFSFQFTFYHEDRKTGDVTQYIAHITKCNNYLLAIKTIKNVPNAWKIDRIMDEIKSLAQSQGFYSRLYSDLCEVRDNDADKWQDVVNELEAQKFTNAVDMVLYFEN